MSKKKLYFKKRESKKKSVKKKDKKTEKKVWILSPELKVRSSLIIFFFIFLNFLLAISIIELSARVSESEIHTFKSNSNDILPARRGAGFPFRKTDRLFLPASSPSKEARGIRRSENKHILPIFDKKFDLDISAQSYVVYDPDSRVVIAGKNERLRFAPASAAKIMTALVTLEYYSLDDVLTVSNLDEVEGSYMGLFEGEKITVENLLYGLLLPSGNDAAYTLAQNYPGGLASFVNKMNEKGDALKLVNTYFSDPSGYKNENYTTAFDLSRLAAYALNNDEFQKIVKTKSKIVESHDKKTVHKLENLNKLLDGKQVLGIKTGFTEEAGGVLVTSFAERGITYIIVVLKSGDRFKDSEELISKVVKSIRLVDY